MRMKISGFLSAVLLACSLISVKVTAETSLDITSVDLDTLDYVDSSLWPGVRSTVVTGNPQAPGLFTTHAWMAEGSIVPPHTHPDPRITVVTHGTMYVGTGEIYDEKALVAYPEGSIFVTPAGSPHFMWARDGDTAVLDAGAGPTGIDVLEN